MTLNSGSSASDTLPAMPIISDAESASLPFDGYPDRGRILLGHVSGGNCRHSYGLRLIQITGKTNCAYCGMSLVDTYEHWLNMAVDHAIPDSIGKLWNIPAMWMDDYSNRLLCCAACNTFRNRYSLPQGSVCPTTLEEFYQLRDKVFLERRALIRQSHKTERAFYDATFGSRFSLNG